LSNPSAEDTTYVFTNGTAGSADYTTTSQTVTVPAGNYGNCFVPTTADTIAESMRLYHCLWKLSTGTINDNDNAPTVATITPASATEGVCCV
jgi:hypothetical protein